MAGATLTLDTRQVVEAVNRAVEVLDDPESLFRDMGEFLHIAIPRRFTERRGPDGTPWAALSPRYLKRKTRNKTKILIRDDILRGTLRYRVTSAGLAFGSNRPYAAIHHFGGKTGKGHRVLLPARPWLWTSTADTDELAAIALDHLAGAFEG